MQTIATATRRRVVYREVQVIAAKEPLEGAAGFHVPVSFSGDKMRFEAGGDHRLRLHRLLIEAGAFTISRVKTIGADGNEMFSLYAGVL